MANEDAIPPLYEGDINNLIALLKTCPNWQYDKHHAHCGLRTPLIPRLEFIQVMLNQGVGIDWQGWKRDPVNEMWENYEGVKDSRGDRKWVWVEKKHLSQDKRLSLAEFLATSVGKDFWTAGTWDWNGEY